MALEIFLEVLRCLAYMIVGAFFTLMLALSGFVASGNGHGHEPVTEIFLILTLLPLPLLDLVPFSLFSIVIALSYWTLVSLLLHWAKLKTIRIIVSCLVVVHYINSVVYLFRLNSEQYDDFVTYWHLHKESVLFIILFYCAGQLLIW